MKHFNFVLKITLRQVHPSTGDYSCVLYLAVISEEQTQEKDPFFLVKHICKNSLPTGILVFIILNASLISTTMYSRVVTNLKRQFPFLEQKKGFFSFHDQILLFSLVSGLEYHDNNRTLSN